MVPTVTRALHRALAPYVTSCVGYDERPHVDSVHHGLPSTALTVIIAFDEPLDCGWLGEPESDRYWTLIGGLHDGAALIRTHGHQHGLQLSLTPAGARSLLGMPAGKLGGTLVRADATPELQRCLGRDLHPRLADAGWAERFALVEQRLLERLAHSEQALGMVPEVAEAWRLTVATKGQLPVAEVARRVGWSRRHLQAHWAAEIGLGPKRVARVARFGYAKRLHEAGLPLTEVAHRAGYADQSHLNRDWRALAGQSPAQTAEDFPIVLADVDVDGARSQP